VQIDRLELRNFGSHESTDLDLRDRGLVLIEGENRDQGGNNGAGKSTLLEGLCWCLFGKTISGVKGDDVCRLGSQFGTRATAVLDLDGRRVQINRYRNRPQSDKQLQVFVDGVDISGPTPTATQPKISNLLQLDWNSFINVVMFPQGRSGIASQSDAEQKNVLDQLLSLNRFAKARLRIREIHESTKHRCTKLENDIKQIEAQQDAEDDAMRRLEDASEKFEDQRKENIDRLKNEIAVLKDQTLDEPEALRRRSHELQYILEQHNQRASDVDNLCQQFKAKLADTRRIQAEHQTKFNMLEHQANDIKIIDPEQELSRNEVCPACKQLLPEEARQQLYTTYRSQAIEAHKQREDLMKRAYEYRQLMETENERAKECSTHISAAEIEKEDTSDLEEELRDITEQLAIKNREIQEFHTRLQSMEMQLLRTTSDANPYEKLYKDAIKQKRDTAKVLKLKKKELKPTKEELHYQAFWLNGFGSKGVKSLLLSTVTPYINERANLYFSELTGGTGRIEIATQTRLKSGEYRDKLAFKVMLPGGPESYKGKSGGERRRADIAILFALGDLAANRSMVPVGCRFVDEVADSLDALGCEQVVALLHKYVLARSSTVLVISHNEALKTLFENRITVVKENGISRIM
jgi:DNA repair exonuclease SbcCD ATPase subunit